MACSDSAAARRVNQDGSTPRRVRGKPAGVSHLVNACSRATSMLYLNRPRAHRSCPLPSTTTRSILNGLSRLTAIPHTVRRPVQRRHSLTIADVNDAKWPPPTPGESAALAVGVACRVIKHLLDGFRVALGH